jgi:hypothetical protein
MNREPFSGDLFVKGEYKNLPDQFAVKKLEFKK